MVIQVAAPGEPGNALYQEAGPGGDGARAVDDALQRQLAAKSRAQAAKFSWERTARQSLAVYDVVAQQ